MQFEPAAVDQTLQKSFEPCRVIGKVDALVGEAGRFLLDERRQNFLRPISCRAMFIGDFAKFGEAGFLFSQLFSRIFR
jgi:hypothetical protein